MRTGGRCVALRQTRRSCFLRKSGRARWTCVLNPKPKPFNPSTLNPNLLRRQALSPPPRLHIGLITSAANGQPPRTPHTPVGDDATLDEGEWVRQWSNSKKRTYYYNTITGESAWNPGSGDGEGAMQEGVHREEERVLKELEEPQRLRDSGLVFAVMSPSMVRVHTQLIDQGLGAYTCAHYMHTYFTCLR